jgi:SAM-dependent methyltransferase
VADGRADYERGGTQKDEYSNDEAITVPCPLCGASDASKLYQEYGTLGIKRCSTCSLIYTSPRLREPEQIYWGDYESYLTEARLIFSGDAPHHRDRNYREELELIEAHAPGTGRFLDVGCNMGMLLRIARDRGWDAIGVEPSPALHRIATEELGLEVHNCFLDAVPAAEYESFDVVALSDVFEHVSNPREFLSTAARYLKPDGFLYVKVPNARWNLLKQRIANVRRGIIARTIWDSYEHVVHYTDATLKEMLRVSGYEPVVVTVSRPVQLPVWHECVGQYYQYPSPWILDWKRHLGRSAFYQLSRAERLARRGSVGYCAPNLTVLARLRAVDHS